LFSAVQNLLLCSLNKYFINIGNENLKKKKINNKKFNMMLKMALKEKYKRKTDSLLLCEEFDKIYKPPIKSKQK